MANEVTIRRDGDINRRTTEHHERISRHSGRNEAIIAEQTGRIFLPARSTELSKIDSVSAHGEDFAVGQANGIEKALIFRPRLQAFIPRSELSAAIVGEKKPVFTVEQHTIGT